MVFSSIVFLWLFFPIVFILHRLLGVVGKLLDSRRESKQQGLTWKIWLQNIWLLIASLIFYAWGEPRYVFIMIASIVLNYFGGLAIAALQRGTVKKVALGVVVILNLSILGYFKYFSTAFSLLESITGLDLESVINVVLPIGISFYTFQAISYVVDVYRGGGVQKNFLLLALYITLFPQLVAGPIVKYGEICAQLESRTITADKTFQGVRRFIYGLCKKVLIANQLAICVDVIFALQTSDLSTLLAWGGIILYTLQIYFDFSGYSDMAIGLGLMFGFKFPENFNLPYISRSIREFWRRWHISLSSWFKEYLYIPLGGNRKGKARTYINLLIVFFATGIWHGAGLSFIVWGLYHGFFMVAERLGLGKLLDRKNAICSCASHVYTLVVVMIGWVFFRADTLTDSVYYLHAMFVPVGSGAFSFFEIIDTKTIVIAIVGILLAGPLQQVFARLKRKEVEDFVVGGPLVPIVGKDVSELVVKSMDTKKVSSVLSILQFVLFMVLLLVCIVNLVAGTYNPFIYFRF